MNNHNNFGLGGGKSLRLQFLIYFLYTLALDFSLWFVAQIFAYQGCVYLFAPLKTLFSYGLVGLLIFLNHRYLPERVTGFFCIGIFSLFILPAVVYFMRSNSPYWHGIWIVLGYVWFLLTSYFLRRVPLRIKFPGNRYIFWCIIGLLSLCNYALLLYFSGIRLNFSLSMVYEIRDQFLSHKSLLLGYLVVWQGNIINPLLFYWTTERKSYWGSILILLLQIYLFSVTGLKIFLFSIFFAYLMAKFAKQLYVGIPLTLTAGLAFSCFYYWYQGSVWFMSFFAYRNLFTPGRLTFEYFEFFNQNPFVYLSDSVLKRFLAYPYPLPPSLLIGIRYHDGGSANVGIMGNAFMHFGTVGIFSFLALLSIILACFDRIASARSDSSPVIFALVATPIISIINSGLFTVLLTHGLILCFFLAYFMDFKIATKSTGQ
jgi:hypothetical protein